jgi:hypothetical protein
MRTTRQRARHGWRDTKMEGDMTDFNEPRVVRFSPRQQLPVGWYVVQLDSGHYMATNGRIESCITVYLWDAWRWARRLANEDK